LVKGNVIKKKVKKDKDSLKKNIINQDNKINDIKIKKEILKDNKVISKKKKDIKKTITNIKKEVVKKKDNNKKNITKKIIKKNEKKSLFGSLKDSISNDINKDTKSTKDINENKKLSFTSLKESISKNINDGTKGSKDFKKNKKSPFASLKDSISKDINKDSKKGFDMAFLKATIQDTLKEKTTEKVTESKIQTRAPTGIEGFDETIEGGFIKNSATLLCGGPGSGKSIFAMQYLINGIDKYGENGVYISFEEEPETLIEDMKRFDFDIENKIKNKQIAILYFSPEQVDRVISIGGGPVREVVESINAKRAVIDSVTAFTLLYKTSNEQRKALMSLFKTLKKWDCTTLLISEQTLNPEEHVSTVEEYQSEGVIFIYNIKKGDVRERSIEVFKMRGTNHSTKINPLKITFDGITVYPEHNVY
jgi:KaiC/GvpD/RAD55 family RecA-like ATPase